MHLFRSIHSDWFKIYTLLIKSNQYLDQTLFFSMQSPSKWIRFPPCYFHVILRTSNRSIQSARNFNILLLFSKGKVQKNRKEKNMRRKCPNCHFYCWTFWRPVLAPKVPSYVLRFSFIWSYERLSYPIYLSTHLYKNNNNNNKDRAKMFIKELQVDERLMDGVGIWLGLWTQSCCNKTHHL